MVEQPQPPRALQTGGVTRFGQMLASQWGNSGQNTPSWSAHRRRDGNCSLGA
jgi:hypothetical protein